MKRRIRAYYDFAEYSKVVGSDLRSPTAWNALRISDARFFSLSERRRDWLNSFADREDLRERAHLIASLCREQGLRRVFSVGVGVGALEYFMKNEDPDLHLIFTDYAPRATARLRSVSSECDVVVVFDMMHNEWQPVPDTLYLLHRVDTKLSDKDWRTCFSRMAASAVSPASSWRRSCSHRRDADRCYGHTCRTSSTADLSPSRATSVTERPSGRCGRAAMTSSARCRWRSGRIPTRRQELTHRRSCRPPLR